MKDEKVQVSHKRPATANRSKTTFQQGRETSKERKTVTMKLGKPPHAEKHLTTDVSMITVGLGPKIEFYTQ